MSPYNIYLAVYITGKTTTRLCDGRDVKHFAHGTDTHGSETQKDSTLGVNDGNKAESIQN